MKADESFAPTLEDETVQHSLEETKTEKQWSSQSLNGRSKGHLWFLRENPNLFISNIRQLCQRRRRMLFKAPKEDPKHTGGCLFRRIEGCSSI